MAAIARGVGDEISDPTGSPDLAGLSREDRGIEEEWRSIERQRVAAEIDEAKEDVGSSVLSAQHSDVFNVRSRWLIVPLSTAARRRSACGICDQRSADAVSRRSTNRSAE